MKGIAFKDRVFSLIQAGDGGDGCSSFRREKYVDMGGPDGGDGGRGGSVHVRASKDVDSLVSLYYQPIQRARSGGRGKGAQRTGENGGDIVIEVPCGTQIWEVPGWTGKSRAATAAPEGASFIDFEAEAEAGHKSRIFEAERVYLGEVVHDGDQMLLAKGGRGGRGNQHFATPSHQAPTECTPGTPGEARAVIMELKTVADVGLVGYPNAGKSTVLSKLTNAHPRIAAYPFTTVNPLIGTVVFDDYSTLRMADIPGLIEGAHEGIGLGHEFLRHIERSSFLVYVIDMSGQEGRNPVDDYRKLRKELKLYDAELLKRPGVILANKMDMPEAEAFLREFKRRTRTKPIPVIAELGEGLGELKSRLYEWKRGLVPFDGSSD